MKSNSPHPLFRDKVRDRRASLRRNRQVPLAITLILLMGILLAACTPGASPPTESSTTSGTATESAGAGGTLIVATNLEPDPTNPHNRSESNLAWYLAVYDTLTQYDENLEPQPRLAESWEWNEDFRWRSTVALNYRPRHLPTGWAQMNTAVTFSAGLSTAAVFPCLSV